MRNSILRYLNSTVHGSILLILFVVVHSNTRAEESIEDLKKLRLQNHELMVKQLGRDYGEGIASFKDVAKAERRLVKLKRELEVDYQDEVAFYSKLLEIAELNFRIQQQIYRAGGAAVSPLDLQRTSLRILKFKQRVLESKEAKN